MWLRVMVWFEFLICGVLLTFFAYNLCKEGVIISDRTHLEEGVIGMFFLAVATSFPEIVTGGVAVFALDKVGLGYGDIVGSVMANLMILSALDYFSGKGRILSKVSSLNRVTGIFVVGVVSVVLVSIILRFKTGFMPVFGRVGIESIFIVLIYFVYLRLVHKRSSTGHKSIYHVETESFWNIWAKFILFLVVVIFLGMWMAKISEKIVLSTGMSETFTGTLILGVATSLPEIIVSFTALRAASIDMAVGNILGSNLFDVCIIPFFDVLCKKPILGLLTPGQILATVLVLILSIIAAGSMFIKKQDRSKIGWDTGLIFIVGSAGFVLLYFIR
ncbi:MAG: hypothetical protein KJ864_00815 [Candidatus Omnitrophica bacterium]|nr:hypothetical protein [Candidatus Omnitrophota bacterium]